MYQPAHFKVEDQSELLAFMDAHGFVTLVTAPDGVPFATHLPMLVAQEGDKIYLRSHVARGNKQWQHFDGREVLVIFQGPHALIDPAWYDSAPNVPTWNYTAVHAYGLPRVVEGAATRQIAYGLVQKYTPNMQAIPEDAERRMLAGVVTFEIEVTRLEGKYKLSQNKTAQDRQNVAHALSQSTDRLERQTGEMMAERERGV